MLGLSISSLISRIVVLITAFSVHEFAHAWTADQFGDNTPRLNGRLTLNPLAHLDVMGSLMLLVAGFGWAKPVPVNPYALNRRSASALMWVSLAGPLSNLLLAVLAAVPLRFNLVPQTYPSSNAMLPTAFSFLYEFLMINLLLMVFNLIPLAPLDGDKIADFLFPPAWQRALQAIRPYGSVILLVLLFVLPYVGLDIFSWLIWPPIQFLANLLIG
ncbi:MAG: site-2 protease family protein [Anaerolineales bacterium]|jgi:Zn-dependent protease|nr:site-2 protease family protein [Anaerolineales bacterium]